MENDWLDTQFEQMVSLVESWCNINSCSYHRDGLAQMLQTLDEAFTSSLYPDEKKIVEFQNGNGLFLKKRESAPIQIFLGGHLDTVFPPDHPFQKVTYINDRTLQGPGVSDMKGGLVVMLKALEAFEQKGFSEIGWRVFLNPDEEIGSPHSTPFIQACARNSDLALLFEPTLPDGSFVCARKGASGFHARAFGKAAHAGRDPEKGVNAIYSLSHFVTEISGLHSPSHDKIVNVGRIQGGQAANIVPEFAECDLNIRASSTKTLHALENKIVKVAHKRGVQIERKSHRFPKLFDPQTQALFTALKSSAQKLGLSIKWKESGGVCDGNTLAHIGVPTIDTLGVHGANLHTDKELIHLESLLEKAKLTLFFLTELASGKVAMPRRHRT